VKPHKILIHTPSCSIHAEDGCPHVFEFFVHLQNPHTLIRRRILFEIPLTCDDLIERYELHYNGQPIISQPLHQHGS
jgi:hypothetical protein